MFKQSFITLVIAVALTAACKSRDVNTNAGPNPRDAATANASSSANDREAQRTSAANATTLSVTDQQFVQKAAAGGRKEVELGRYAQQHASSDAVKQLGQKIADDHERANRELEAMLGGSDVARTSAASDDDSTRSRLEKMTGREFDRAYVEEMINDHQKDITEFERAAQSTNQKVKSFATQTLPTLREHLQQARDAQAAIGK